MIIKTTILVILITINFINTQELLDDDLLEVKLSEDVDDEKSPNSSPLLLVGPHDAALRSDLKVMMMMMIVIIINNDDDHPGLATAQPGWGAYEQIWLQRHSRVPGELLE